MGTEPFDHPTAEFLACLQAARAGEAAALGPLLEGLRPYLLRTANASLDDRWRAKASGSDLVQETFLEAARQFARFEGHTQRELMAWLHGILHNKVRTLARHYIATEKRQAAREVSLTPAATDAHPDHDPAAPGPTPSGHAIAAETDANLRAALERLPAHYRQVIVWRQWDELSFEDIAQRLGKGVDAARMLWRAVAQLQRQLRPGD